MPLTADTAAPVNVSPQPTARRPGGLTKVVWLVPRPEELLRPTTGWDPAPTMRTSKRSTVPPLSGVPWRVPPPAARALDQGCRIPVPSVSAW
jgi:hypothetical protein